MRGYLCLSPSKSEASFIKGEAGYYAPQVGTFGVALDSVSYSYEDLCGHSERMKELLDKGLYSEKNYVNKVPYGTVVYVDSWLEEDAIAVVKLCVITDIGKTIGVRNKWAVLQWDWDYSKDDEDHNYREFTDWLDLEDQAVINGLKLSYRPEVLKDPEKLVYKVEDVKDEYDKNEYGKEGMLVYSSSEAMAHFREGRTAYAVPQLYTFGMADHPKHLYLGDDSLEKSVRDYVDKKVGEGSVLKKENYVPSIPHGALVFIMDYISDAQFVVVRLCKLTEENIIVVTKKWGFLWWGYDDSYGETDDMELRNFLNLEDAEIRNVLRVDERKRVCGKDLHYYVQFEITGDDAGVVGLAGPKPENCIKATESPKYKEVKLDGAWVKEHYEAIRKGEVLLVEGAVLHDILNEAGKNFYNFLGNALGLYSIRLMEKKGATDGVSELYTGTLMNLQENITRTFVKLYDKIEEKAYKTKFEEDENG